MADDPIRRFNRWFNEARRAGIPLPEAMAVATADTGGRPSVRYVLLKQADAQGFVFFTNTDSRKGHELAANPYAAAAIYWDPLGKQVRVEGRVDLVAGADADAYWATRPRESQLAALASHQSADLASRAALLSLWRQLQREYRGQQIPRPLGWTGFRIIPDAIEFWTHRPHRLHDRELYIRTRNSWTRKRLQP